MRMRKKKNLVPRMEACGALLIEDPRALRGRWRELLPEARELRVELGCGKGRFTAETAAAEPDVLLIAVEKVPDAMVVAMERARDAGLHNVFFVDGDAACLPDFFAPGEVDRIYINFCDPVAQEQPEKAPPDPRQFPAAVPPGAAHGRRRSTSKATTTSCSSGPWRRSPNSASGCPRSPRDLHAGRPRGGHDGLRGRNSISRESPSTGAWPPWSPGRPLHSRRSRKKRNPGEEDPRMIIESHAHYSHKRYDGVFRYLTSDLKAQEGQREDLLDRLRESGVVLSIEPGIDFESNRRTAALYRQHPDFIRLAVGVHPTRTHQAPWRQRRQLEAWAREPGVAAIGETGLDYHLPRKHRLTQLLWFRYQLGLARRLGLPLVLHIRMADRDALAMLRRRRRHLPGGVVHCFQGDWDTARAYLDLGFCLGIGGALLRRESEALRDAVARAPLDRLLVETDSPYVLPDVPWTGSKKSLSRVRNSSLLLPRVVEEIARLKHLPPETAEAAILENTRRVFHLSGAENGG